MMPSCDQTGVPGVLCFTHFHSSTTSGSASLISLRILLRVFPRQSPSSAILVEMCSDADWSWLAPDFFMFFSPQLTAFFTSALILPSSATVNSFSAKATGHRAPSSRFAVSLKPNVAYLVLNFCAFWKKQTTFPSLLAYAGIPYQVFGERAGAVA